MLDESTLTGEPLPAERRVGDDVRSGAVNAGRPFRMRATRRAADSTYAGIVHLVTEAEADAANAPFVRLADRYAGGFLVVSIVIAALARGRCPAIRSEPLRCSSSPPPARSSSPRRSP